MRCLHQPQIASILQLYALIVPQVNGQNLAQLALPLALTAPLDASVQALTINALVLADMARTLYLVLQHALLVQLENSARQSDKQKLVIALILQTRALLASTPLLELLLMTILYRRRVDCALLALPLLVEEPRALPVLQVHFQPRLAHLYAQTVLLALHHRTAHHRVQLVQLASIQQDLVVHALLVQLESSQPRLAHHRAQTVLLALHHRPAQHPQHHVQPVWPASIPQQVVNARGVELESSELVGAPPLHAQAMFHVRLVHMP